MSVGSELDKHLEIVEVIVDNIDFDYETGTPVNFRADASAVASDLISRGWDKKIFVNTIKDLMDLPEGSVVREDTGEFSKRVDGYSVGFDTRLRYMWRNLVLPVEVISYGP